MAVVSELIRLESDGTVSFGDYSLDAKSKLDNVKHQGDIYKVKTFKEITKLEKNGTLVYESVPGSTVTGFKSNDEVVEFDVEAPGDISFTLEMQPSTEYKLVVDGVSAGRIL